MVFRKRVMGKNNSGEKHKWRPFLPTEEDICFGSALRQNTPRITRERQVLRLSDLSSLRHSCLSGPASIQGSEQTRDYLGIHNDDEEIEIGCVLRKHRRLRPRVFFSDAFFTTINQLTNNNEVLREGVRDEAGDGWKRIMFRKIRTRGGGLENTERGELVGTRNGTAKTDAPSGPRQASWVVMSRLRRVVVRGRSGSG